MRENESKAAWGAVLLVSGAFIGAGIALLFAPQSGRETRNDIARYAKRARRKANRVVDEFTDNVSEMVETVSEKAEELLETGKDLAHDARKEVVSAIEAGRDRLDEQRKRFAKLVG